MSTFVPLDAPDSSRAVYPITADPNVVARWLQYHTVLHSMLPDLRRASPDVSEDSIEFLLAGGLVHPEETRKAIENTHRINKEIERVGTEAERLFAEIRGSTPVTDLSLLYPAGELCLANAGHNGYSWEGSAGPFLPPSFRDDPQSLDGLLCSSAIIGSSSDVWVPTIPVRQATEATPLSMKDDVPSLLIFDDGQYREAHYVPAQGEFIPAPLSRAIQPEVLSIEQLPAIHRSYYKENDCIPPRPRFVDWVTNHGLFARLDAIRTGRTRDKMMARFYERLSGLAHRLVNTPGTIEEYLISRYAPSANHAREVGRLLFYAGVDDKHVVEQSYYTSLPETVSVLKEGVDSITLLTRFFLVKAFERTVQASGKHYIVGQITGDSLTIHMPYMEVRPRQMTPPM